MFSFAICKAETIAVLQERKRMVIPAVILARGLSSGLMGVLSRERHLIQGLRLAKRPNTTTPLQEVEITDRQRMSQCLCEKEYIPPLL